MLYGTTRFIVERGGLQSFLRWLRTIGPHNCQFLKYLHLNLQGAKISRNELASSDAQTTMARLLLETILSCRVEQITKHLRQASFQLVELLMDEHLLKKIEPALLNIKTSTIVIWDSTKIRHDSAVFKKMWATEVIVMGRNSKTMKYCRTATLTSRRAKGFYYLATFRNTLGWPMDIFSNLPAEIRRIVYKLLLEQAHEIRPLDYALDADTDAASTTRSAEHVAHIQPIAGLLRASPIIHHEATSVLFGSNVFRLLSSTPNGATKWLETINVSNVSKLRYVRISADHMLREVRRLQLRFPWLDRIEWGTRPVQMPNRPLGRIMEARMNEALRIMKDVFEDTIQQATDDAVADQISAIHLLQACPTITRLDILMPRSWSISDGWFAGGVRIDPVLSDDFDNEDTGDIFDALATLKISVELRIGADYPRWGLEDAIKSTGVQEAVIYAVSHYFAEEDNEEYGGMENWQMAPCGREERLRLHPATVPNVLERSIAKIWPQPHSTTCIPGSCRPLREPE